ncbi:MAG: hypothetical protein AB7K09_08895 [Planctomycetota bacterium]
MATTVALTDAREGPPAGFCELAAQVYAGDPDWIPEDPAAVRAAFSAGNPWFADGDGDNRAWVACVPGVVRAALFVPAGLQMDGQRTAFVGYWECTDGADDAAGGMLAALEDHARGLGIRQLLGPVNFGTAGNYRFVVRREPGAVPFVGEPYNPLRYAGTWTAHGYGTHLEYLTQLTRLPEERRQQGRTMQQRLERSGYRFVALTPDEWLSRLDELHGVVNAIFAENPGYRPINAAMFRSLCGASFIRKTCPVSSVLALDPSGAVAGFSLLNPHWGPLVVQGAGESRVPVGEIDHAVHFARLQSLGPVSAICKTLGVLPPFRHRGLMVALTAWMLDRGESLYDTWYGALIRSDNPSRKLGTRTDFAKRWYVLLGKSLD